MEEYYELEIELNMKWKSTLEGAAASGDLTKSSSLKEIEYST